MGRAEIEAVSGIFGAISIACWVVVFTPQLFQNFRRKNADALSIHFILIWLIGDIFNVIGSVSQGVLTSMIILAIYYTVADFALLGQMFFYRGFHLSEIFTNPLKPAKKTKEPEGLQNHTSSTELIIEKHGEQVDPDCSCQLNDSSQSDCSDEANNFPRPKSSTFAVSHCLRSLACNVLIILAVGVAGFVGWLISNKITGGKGNEDNKGEDVLEFNTTGQVFGYLSAVTYISSRLPQLLLNWRRKATEGLSMLFFAFAFLGNVTYMISILAHNPNCEHKICRPGEAAHLYKRYLLINFSWIMGSSLNLIQDCGIFIQHFLYRNNTSN